jgi:hypothetical protein
VAAPRDGVRFASTRERADAVLAALPSRVANAEFFQDAL